MIKNTIIGASYTLFYGNSRFVVMNGQNMVMKLAMPFFKAFVYRKKALVKRFSRVRIMPVALDQI
ncbi:hypothetical protein [Flavobacterium kingsejongi]|uniref:Uncharacterized protein n=1 Tax=Flavobacterium kingsejongi TaxID=1678728 RepID=A0A2S1LNE8_9FLAO|nr:hypothetical protein [Flavobacterium kingsejongi]AWG25290.1 hypothetical protein FK004_08600 [Flavobacterium kingsejongi]